MGRTIYDGMSFLFRSVPFVILIVAFIGAMEPSAATAAVAVALTTNLVHRIGSDRIGSFPSFVVVRETPRKEGRTKEQIERRAEIG